jgi:ankyrin repeat protein
MRPFPAFLPEMKMLRFRGQSRLVARQGALAPESTTASRLPWAGAASRCFTWVLMFSGALHAGLALAGIGGEPMDALRRGDHEALKAALDDGFDARQMLPDRSVPLLWAVELQDLHAVRMLLDHGADPNGEPVLGSPFSPLYLACEAGDGAMVEVLMAAGSAVDQPGPDGVPPLAPCAAHAPLATLRAMLEEGGADPEASGWRGQTPLMWAAASDRDDAVRYLLDAGAARDTITAAGFNALFFAIKSGGTKALQALLDAGAAAATYRGPEGTSALQLALYQQNFPAARLLLPHSPGDAERVDRNGQVPLHLAAAAGDTELVAALLETGADPNVVPQPPRVPWRYESNFRSGDYRFPKLSPLLMAARAGHAAAMDLLLRAGAEPAYKTPAGEEVLLSAARSGDPAALKVALSAASDINIRDRSGKTALHIVLETAEAKSKKALAELLLADGARVDIPDDAGVTGKELLLAPEFSARAELSKYLQTGGVKGP